MKPTPLDALASSKPAWLPSPAEEHPIVLASRVRLVRNLSGARFPSAAPEAALIEVRRKIFDAVRESRVLEKPDFLSFDDLGPQALFLLQERRLIGAEAAVKPRGRGLALGSGETLSVLVNAQDHLRLQAMGPGLCLSAVFAYADKLDTLLGRRLGFAFKPRWGYLASSPADAGSGLRASALAHLGAVSWLGRLAPLLEGAAREGVLVRGLAGKSGLLFADLFQFSNGTALGKSETEYVNDFNRFLKGLFDAELRAQQDLLKAAHRARFEDAAHRCWGVLMSAQRLSYEEMLSCVSVLRLAARLGLAPSFDAAALLDLAASAQPAHLRYIEKRAFSTEEEPAKRARFVRARLQEKGPRSKGAA